VDPTDRTCWPEAFKWLKNQAETFHKAFSQRIKGLPIQDEGDQNEHAGTENG
jgi:hypothetical protein